VIKDQDTILVRECLDGNPEPFEKLIDKYQKKLFNLALRMVGDYDDAKEITQITFVKAYERLDTFDSKYKFFSWIYRILVNESINFLKQKRQHMALNQNMVAAEKTPEESLNSHELNRVVDEAVGELPVDYRMVIVFRHFADLTYRELSFVLGVPEKTIKSRLFTGRQLLGKILTKRGVVLHA
jgi:RNA polymerase sigma-70 factor (ECF subfamily)